ncbi:protein enabled homolog [Larimichthys crocea]|uniref:protein enabled homolog n=1 Tax=Larimichthys crocea TaxID=215358 RepID=UPI000F5E5107|nr:protein enabled homolog [Larimichthys crocea]
MYTGSFCTSVLQIVLSMLLIPHAVLPSRQTQTTQQRDYGPPSSPPATCLPALHPPSSDRPDSVPPPSIPTTASPQPFPPPLIGPSPSPLLPHHNKSPSPTNLCPSLHSGSTCATMTERSDQNFDPAVSAGLLQASSDHRQALASQGTLIGQHDRVLHEVVETLRGLTATVSRIQNQFSAAQSPSVPASPSPFIPGPPPAMPSYMPREPYVPAPERYDGDLGTCQSFLLQCSLVFDLQPQTYAYRQVQNCLHCWVANWEG